MPQVKGLLKRARAAECRPGHATFHVNRDPWMEIERCDDRAQYEDDDAAAVAFVRDLERGAPYAIEQLKELLPDRVTVRLEAESGSEDVHAN